MSSDAAANSLNSGQLWWINLPKRFTYAYTNYISICNRYFWALWYVC